VSEVEIIPTASPVPTHDAAFSNACVALGQALVTPPDVPHNVTHPDHCRTESFIPGGTSTEEFNCTRSVGIEAGQSSTSVDKFCGPPHASTDLCVKYCSKSLPIANDSDHADDDEDGYLSEEEPSCAGSSTFSVHELIDLFEQHTERSLTCQGKHAVVVLGRTTVKSHTSQEILQ
jgi:hypothetical protein